ncbi:MAG: 1-deoxy-D-xylulose-5-phosphate reductoisomerase [Oscillospiraceae bacterium]|nr:1-deoxy-D-xylulose-5-phosphate reductoisomerase [Oscillospiraceae bacterium]
MKENKSLCVLGSTGSIGTQALEVARALGLHVTALAANSNTALLETQIREFHPKSAALADEKAAADLRVRIADTSTKVLGGSAGMNECAACGANTVLNAIVGIAGLQPTLSAIAAGSDIALANKETLVAGGALVTDAAREKGVRLLPVDSEHSAIFQALQGSPNGATHSFCPPMPPPKSLKRLILTASGGPFFGKTRAELEHVTLADALRHPNWNMGAKITVDSATMFNKGLELIEAVRLFHVPPEQVDVVMHRQSVVHSLIEYRDNSVIAQLGVPDMKIPIQYAVTYPERLPCPAEPLDLTRCGTLTFEPPDDEAFPAIKLARNACAQDGLATAVYNGANEQANALFRTGAIRFLQIAELVTAAVSAMPYENTGHNMKDVLHIDSWARAFVLDAARKE